MNTQERKNDLLRIIEQLDITPTMYKNAEEKYKNLAAYLESKGIEADMYPQGSFALGTVIRPTVRDPNAGYDLDFVCQVHAMREDTTPAELRKLIEDALTSSDLYGGKLTIYDECFTVTYANIGNYGFSIDIVPAVDEREQVKARLQQKAAYPDLISTSIAIPKKEPDVYTWLTNNPKGYLAWFNGINNSFAEHSWENSREKIFRENNAVYASVEEIPPALNRSSIQRVIQILKYHRDVFYSKYPNGEDIKPISAIINTIVVKMADGISPDISVFDLLDYITTELSIYEKRQMLSEQIFSLQYPGRNVIQIQDNKWVIFNPANPEDNLADKWNEDKRIPRVFFRWCSCVHHDLIDSFKKDDEVFRSIVEGAFGQKMVSDVWGEKYRPIPTRPIQALHAAKPWG